MTPNQLKEEKDRDKFFNGMGDVDDLTIEQIDVIANSSSTSTNLHDNEFYLLKNQEEPESKLGSAFKTCEDMGIKY